MAGRDLVLSFVNTRLERPTGVVEALTNPETATRWLAEHLMWPAAAPLSRAEYDTARRLRGALRRLLYARIDRTTPDQTELAVLNQCNAAALRVEALGADWSRTTFFVGGTEVPRSAEQLFAWLAALGTELLSDPDARIAECAADDCVIIFVRSDPRRRWHSTRCGNRMRAARSYTRHHRAS